MFRGRPNANVYSIYRFRELFNMYLGYICLVYYEDISLPDYAKRKSFKK
jgi:hypothetical protein